MFILVCFPVKTVQCFLWGFFAGGRLGFFFKIVFIHLRERAQAGEVAEVEVAAGSWLSREPDAGLDPGIMT